MKDSTLPKPSEDFMLYATTYKGRTYFPAYSSLGAYTLVYYTAEMEPLCSDCATTDYFEWLYSLNTCEGRAYDPPVIVTTYDEGPDEICAGCNKHIPSTYGDPWEGQDNESE